MSIPEFQHLSIYTSTRTWRDHACIAVHELFERVEPTHMNSFDKSEGLHDLNFNALYLLPGFTQLINTFPHCPKYRMAYIFPKMSLTL